MIILERILNKELINTLSNNNYNSNDMWIGINKDSTYIGCFQLQEFTRITAILHMNITNKYQNKGYALKCYTPLKEFLKLNTNYKSIVASVPESNKAVHKILTKTEFKLIGEVPNSIIWHDKLQNVKLYQLEVA